MAVKIRNGLITEQKWKATADGEEFTISYRCSKLSGKTEIQINNDKYVLHGGIFGIGIKRREVFRLGDCQAILEVSGNGHAQIILPQGNIKEI